MAAEVPEMVHVSAYAPPDLARRFDLARQLDGAVNRSDGLRRAMDAYAEAVESRYDERPETEEDRGVVIPPVGAVEHGP